MLHISSHLHLVFNSHLSLTVSLAKNSHDRFTLLLARQLMIFSLVVYGATEEWCNPDSGAHVGGHVSPSRWRHRLTEAGSANNYISVVQTGQREEM